MEPILRAKVIFFFKSEIFFKSFLLHIGKNKIMLKNFFGYHHALKNYGAPKLCTVYVVKSPILGLQRAPKNLELAPSVLVLSG